MMAHGYNGRILKVDLSSKSWEVEEPDELFYRRYWGGQAFAGHYLLREQSPGADPLGPDNTLVFATGVMTGSKLPAMPRFSVAARSPLTGAFGSSEAGGWWGPELKFAGYDAVVIKGRAERPVYLWIDDGEVEIRDGSAVWGMETGEAQEAIRREVEEPRARVALIGPAGENQVRYACVINEYKHANGRNGLGAVMGSKNLKAIAVRGKGGPDPANPGKVHELAKWYASQVTTNPTVKSLYETGTPGLLTGLDSAGILPTRNFRSGTFEEAGSLGWEAYEKIFVGPKACYACSIRCKRVVKSEGEYQVDPHYGGPEYESLSALGSNCGVGELRAVAKANELCNRYGLDAISTGASIAFAMECFEEGLISREEADGLELRFGNAAAMLALVEKIARREGIGDLLAEGSARASERIGRGSERFAIHVKGQELPMHEPRGKPAVGLGYAISDVGADHLMVAHDPGFQMKESAVLKTLAPLGIFEPVPALDLGPRKVRLYRHMEDIYSFWRAAGVCLFGYAPRVSVPMDVFVDMARAVTGWDFSVFEQMSAGERSTNLTHAFNVREGFRREQDRLPERFFTPLPDGRLKGVGLAPEQVDGAIDLLYQMKGWDPATGIPSRSKLEELDIPWVADTLTAAGAPVT
jgi:aldehyde:ferredoxin oxidoreductase